MKRSNILRVISTMLTNKKDENANFHWKEPATQQNSPEEMVTLLKNQKAKNTIKKTRSDLNILNNNLKSINQGGIKIYDLSFLALDHVLCKFFMQVKKQTEVTTNQTL